MIKFTKIALLKPHTTRPFLPARLNRRLDRKGLVTPYPVGTRRVEIQEDMVRELKAVLLGAALIVIVFLIPTFVLPNTAMADVDPLADVPYQGCFNAVITIAPMESTSLQLPALDRNGNVGELNRRVTTGMSGIDENGDSYSVDIEVDTYMYESIGYAEQTEIVVIRGPYKLFFYLTDNTVGPKGSNPEVHIPRVACIDIN